ncbi:hypothetical protein BD770DRAFT_406088 [Pilaira anomala]|nr:hypothetical protein BD770DRAFT_406088 [Pilaira anomala]
MIYTHDREQVLILKRTTNVEFMDFMMYRRLSVLSVFTVLVLLNNIYIKSSSISIYKQVIKTWMFLAMTSLTMVNCRPMEIVAPFLSIEPLSAFVIPSRHSLSGSSSSSSNSFEPTKSSSYSVEIFPDNILPTFTDNMFPMLHENAIAGVLPAALVTEVQNSHARRLKLKVAIDNARIQIKALNQDL